MWIEFAFNAHRVNVNSIHIQTASSVKRLLKEFRVYSVTGVLLFYSKRQGSTILLVLGDGALEQWVPLHFMRDSVMTQFVTDVTSFAA